MVGRPRAAAEAQLVVPHRPLGADAARRPKAKNKNPSSVCRVGSSPGQRQRLRGAGEIRKLLRGLLSSDRSSLADFFKAFRMREDQGGRH